MSGYRRPSPVRDPRVAAARLLEARSRLIDLVVPRGTAGELAVEITNAIETLEACAENYGAVRDDVETSYVPVSAEELDEVQRAIDERSDEIAERLRIGPSYRQQLADFDRSHAELSTILAGMATLAEREGVYARLRGRLTEGAIWTLRKERGDHKVKGVSVAHPWPRP